MKRILLLLCFLATAIGLKAANPAFKDLVWTNDPGTAHLRSNVTRLGFVDTNTFFYSDPSKQTVGVGYQIFQGGAPDFNNTAVGHQALQSLVTGQENLGIGTFALNAATNSQWNTAVGYFTLKSLKKGSGNVAIGASVLENLVPTTVGDGTANPGENIGVGYQVGQQLQTGQRNILIGDYANVGASSASNNIVIGYASSGERNDVVIGNNIITAGGTESSNVFIGDVVTGGGRYIVAIGHQASAPTIGSPTPGWNVILGAFASTATGITNSTALGAGSSVSEHSTIRFGNNQTVKTINSGYDLATNGFASYSTIATNQIPTTGWTNNEVINMTVYITATAVSFTINNRAGTVLYTSPTLTATMPVNLQPGWSVRAASGLTGTVLPF